MMQAETGGWIKVRFALPRAELRPYVTTYYCTNVAVHPSMPALEDYLHPEWANLRFMQAGWAQSAIGADPVRPAPGFCITGPTSKAVRFRIGPGRSWGIGLLPLGWSALIDAPAGDYADRIVDGAQDHAFAAFHPLARALARSLDSASGDFDDELAIVENHMAQIAARHSPAARSITAINAALIDPEIATVTALAERVGMNVRSLERLSRRAFGFTPKLLLRRQRFLRSLSQFMLDPSLKWLSTLDWQYHDQAHFVRDFKRFMGMSASVYARLDKPFLIAAARARMAIAGEAVQGLHDPAARKS